MTTDPATAGSTKADEVRRLIERSVDDLGSQLAAGNSAQFVAFLRAMGRFHHYSFGNLLLILCQRPEATRVAGFHTWRTLGRTVMRGEKGIAIFAPMMLKPRGDTGDSSPETAGDDRERKPRLRFRVVHVFDVAQTDGEPLPEPTRVGGDPGVFLVRLEQGVSSSGIVLETVPRELIGGAEGVSKGGAIALREGLSPAERFAVLAHEWAHEILHRVPAEERPDKVVRETEAEAVAFAVCQSIGLETGTAAADYIRLYRGNRETLAASLDRIQKAACIIIDAVLGETPQPRVTEHASHESRIPAPAAAVLAAERRQR